MRGSRVKRRHGNRFEAGRGTAGRVLAFAVMWFVAAMPLGACEEEVARTTLPGGLIGSWDELYTHRGGSTIEASWGDAVFRGLFTVILDNPTEKRRYAADHAIVFWPLTMEMGDIYVVTRVEKIAEAAYVIEAHYSDVTGKIVTGIHSHMHVMEIHILSEDSIRFMMKEGGNPPGSTEWSDVVLYRRSGPGTE